MPPLPPVAVGRLVHGAQGNGDEKRADDAQNGNGHGVPPQGNPHGQQSHQEHQHEGGPERHQVVQAVGAEDGEIEDANAPAGDGLRPSPVFLPPVVSREKEQCPTAQPGQQLGHRPYPTPVIGQLGQEAQSDEQGQHADARQPVARQRLLPLAHLRGEPGRLPWLGRTLGRPGGRWRRPHRSGIGCSSRKRDRLRFSRRRGDAVHLHGRTFPWRRRPGHHGCRMFGGRRRYGLQTRLHIGGRWLPLSRGSDPAVRAPPSAHSAAQSGTTRPRPSVRTRPPPPDGGRSPTAPPGPQDPCVR